MGIINVTPDSFSDGGRFLAPRAALDLAASMIADGADILDIGAESTRPGAAPITAEEEWRRLEPVLGDVVRLALSTHDRRVRVSVDTYRPVTAARAVRLGASIINDVRAGQHAGPDGQTTLNVAAEAGATVCLLHMQGNPASMQNAPVYTDVVREVYQFLHHRRAAALAAGVLPQNIWVDPGFGFGKTREHNLTLVHNLLGFRDLGPVVLGLSRKRTLAELSGSTDPGRLPESLAGAIAGLRFGADILRVHDVGSTRRALLVGAAMMG